MARAERAPKGPTQLSKGNWLGTLKRTVKEFQDDNLTDWAAALTYYGLLSLVPALVVSGPVAKSVGQAIGLGSTAITIWNIAKWPVMLVVVLLMFALLYHASPNVKLPRFRWVSPGSVLAIVAWAVASAAFAFYVANFGSYNKTYGTLA